MARETSIRPSNGTDEFGVELSSMRPDEFPIIMNDCRRLMFRQPPHVRAAGRLAVLAALAIAAGLLLWADLSAVIVRSGLLLCTLLFSVGGLAALWIETLEIAFDKDSFAHTRGLSPHPHHKQGSLALISHVELQKVDRESQDRPDDTRYTLRLVSPDGTLQPFSKWRDNRAANLAVMIADRLERPIRIEPILIKRKMRRKVPGLASGVMLAGMLAVTCVMLWPVISGSRPLIDVGRGMRKGTVGAPGAAASLDPRQALFQDGLGFFWAGRYVESEERLRYALRESPGNTEALNMLAYALAEQGKMDEALATAQRSLALAPSSGNILDTVAEMHERRREYAEAAKCYREALRYLDIFESGETRTKFGRTLIALKRRDEALVQLTEAIKYPSPQWDELARRLFKEIAPDREPPEHRNSPFANMMRRGDMGTGGNLGSGGMMRSGGLGSGGLFVPMQAP